MKIREALVAQTLAVPSSSIAGNGGAVGSGTPSRISMWKADDGLGIVDSYLTGPTANHLTVEASANNITLTVPVTGTAALGAASSSASSTNDVTGATHTHAIDSTIARSAVTITAGAGLTGTDCQ